MTIGFISDLHHKKLMAKSLVTFLTIFTLCLLSNPLQALVLTSPAIQQIAISPDNQRIVYVRKDWEGWPNPGASMRPQRLLISSIAIGNGKTLSKAYTPYQPTPNPLGFTPDADKLLAITPAQTGIAVIHNKTGKTLRVIPEPRAAYIKRYARNLSRPVLSPDGSLLALSDTHAHNTRPLAHLMNTGSTKRLHTIPLSAHTMPYSLNFSHDGKSVLWLEAVANSTMPRLVHRYNFYQKKALPPIPLQTTDAHRNQLHPSPDGRHVLLYSGDGIDILDLTTGKERTTYTSQNNDSVSFAAFISPHQYGALLQTNNGAKWITVNIQTQQKKQFNLPVAQPLGSIALSKNRRQLAISSVTFPNYSEKIFLFDTYNGKLIRQFEVAPE